MITRPATTSVSNVIFTGVGGQGSILASHLLAEAALKDGKDVKLAETYGGATRGGSVLSHVRIGEVWSSRIPHDGADVVVAMEPLEALRVARRYVRIGGWVLLNTRPWYPLDVSAGGLPYPPLASVLDALARLGGIALPLDATELAVQAGDKRAANIVMLGALLALGTVGVSDSSVASAIEERLPGNLLEINRRAYGLGQHVVLDSKGQI